MEITEDKLNRDNRNKSLLITICLHLALALLAFYTMLQKIETPVEQSFYIDIQTEPERQEPEVPEESVVDNTPLVNTPADNLSKATKPTQDAGAAKGNDAGKTIGSSAGTNKNTLPASSKSGGSTSTKTDGSQKGDDKFVEDKSSDVALEQKKKYSGLFGKGNASGNGNGNNNPDGKAGDNGGLPDGKALDGLSKGTGRVGGGLNGRGIVYTPEFKDKSQRTGKVALIICVDKNGKVTGADYTQKGSTTSDSYLISLATKTAHEYRFSKSDIESQCGTVTIDFKVM